MKAIVPGSYDPVTLGHLDVIKRAKEKYDEVFAVIFINPKKTYRFSVEDRVRMLTLATDELDGVMVSYSDGLVIDYMREHGIDVIVKGYRNETDLEYERLQAEWNKAHGGYDTELLKCNPALASVSSTRVRAALDEGKGVDELLPDSVKKYIESL
jgi:pantetheine-phosphate adenylyltransferase